MLSEKRLVKQFNQGGKEALCTMYQTYKKNLYGLAISLLNDKAAAEDVVHDVFVKFAQQAGSFQLNGSLKSYFCVCVVNRARDIYRLKSRSDISLDETPPLHCQKATPEEYAIATEEYRQLQEALGQIPLEQREIILLRLHQDISFREIACMQGISINTVVSRYRYGLEKLSFFVTGNQNNENEQTNRKLDLAKEA
jgi:RNA polymerase sigma-70 factor (ECF subfamily)